MFGGNLFTYSNAKQFIDLITELHDDDEINAALKNKYILMSIMDIIGNIHKCSFSYSEANRQEIALEITAIKSLI